MQGYSIGGFLNAVMRRSNRTILVEGVTDQSLLNRLKREHASAIGYEPIGQIDQVGILTDPALEGLGNKEKIKEILAYLSRVGSAKLAIENKFGTLTDREWDGLSVGMDLLSSWNPPAQNSPHFRTLGHSVENYFFYVDSIESYLKQFFSDHVDQDLFNALENRFHAMIGLAATYSLAMRSIGAISKSDGVISYGHIEWIGGRYLVNSSLDSSLHARSIILPTNFHGALNTSIDGYFAQHSEVEPGRWICHGHLGEQAIWACVAHLCIEHRIAAQIAKSIERGSRDNKFKHSVDYLARINLQRSDPLESTLSWLTTDPTK